MNHNKPRQDKIMNVPMQKVGKLDRMETASVDELRHEQLRRLRWSVWHAYTNVPHYRSAFDAIDLKPEDINSLEDIAKIPFTGKEDLRNNYPFKMFAVPMHKVVRVHASSGTTGKPTVVGYTQSDIETWADIVARSIRAGGGHAGDKIHIAYGYGLFTGGLCAHYGAERLGCTVIPMSGGQTEKQVQLIKDFEPDVIMVTPSYMLNLADEIDRQGIDPKKLPLRLGIFGAEPWTNEMRTEIEDRLGIQALDIYGLSEVMGPGVGMECLETKDGPTIWEDHFYPEIVNPETGDVLPDGEYGELVFTSLTKVAMPVLRYRTRDLTRLLPGTARAMRRIDKITGRSDDMLIIRGVNVFPSQVEVQVLKCRALSPHYEIEVYKRGNLDYVDVRVELRAGAEGENVKEHTAKELAHHIKSHIGINTNIDVQDAGSLSRSEGKAKRVFDRRKDRQG